MGHSPPENEKGHRDTGTEEHEDTGQERNETRRGVLRGMRIGSLLRARH